MNNYDLSPTTISLLITGIVTIIGAIAAASISIITALRSTKASVEITKAAIVENASKGLQASNIRDQKLDNITLLVDGRYSEVLQELADVKLLMAKTTGYATDKREADTAQTKADNQNKRVELVKDLAVNSLTNSNTIDSNTIDSNTIPDKSKV